MVIVTPEVNLRIREFAAKGYPEEVCGVLLGHRDRGISIVDVTLVRNETEGTTTARHRYTVDPADMVAARRVATAKGLEMVGMWHSHPHYAAWPSSIDSNFALEGWAYIIVATVKIGATDMNAFMLEPGGHDLIWEELQTIEEDWSDAEVG